MSAILPILLAATIPIRNPFWPVGYVGKLEVITDEPRVETKATTEAETKDDAKAAVNAESIAAAAAAEKLASEADNTVERAWIAARKSLKITSAFMRAEKHQSITINGNIYADGDVVRAVYENCEYFWRVQAITENGTLKLKRLTYREITPSEENEAKESK